MMLRYITDEDTFRVLSEYYHHQTDIQRMALSEVISQVPAADVAEVKHGKWIRKSPTAWMWTCSCCEKDDAYAYSAGESFEPDVLQDLFCPNCGAKMDREEIENAEIY